MHSRFVCLANSYKEGGRCVAGILLDKSNCPILKDGHPKWIRPTCTTEHGEIPTDLVAHIPLLTVLEIEVWKFVGEGHQSENALFNEDSIREMEMFPISKLDTLCDHSKLQIFGNKGKAVAEEHIDRLDHSLMFVQATEFEAIEKINEYKPGTTQIRLTFSYRNIQYEF